MNMKFHHPILVSDFLHEIGADSSFGKQEFYYYGWTKKFQTDPIWDFNLVLIDGDNHGSLKKATTGIWLGEGQGFEQKAQRKQPWR